MAAKVTNNAYGTLSAGITNSATTITLNSGGGARFPALGAGDYFYATLVDTSNNLEIVKVTARSVDSLTVVRAQDGTTARAYGLNDRLELRPVAALFNEKVDLETVTTVARGGTGKSTLTAGSLLAGNGTTAVDEIAPGTSGNILTSNGTSWTSAAAPASGFGNIQVFSASGTFTVPAGITKIKVTVIGGGGGSSTGGTSSFGAYCSATGGGAQNSTGIFNTAGTGSGGNLNVSGQIGSIGYGTCATLGCSSTARGAGGGSAFGIGTGANYTFTQTGSPQISRGGAGGGGTIEIISGLTPGSTHTVTVGASGGGGATAGIVFVEY